MTGENYNHQIKLQWTFSVAGWERQMTDKYNKITQSKQQGLN